MPFNKENLETFPSKPGVYLMKGLDGGVIYVGKAKNIRQRVRQYFVPNGDGRPIIPYLLSKIESIDTIVVSSEKEALLLENNLIKKYKPRYNALLKDDKTYIALKLTHKHPWPKLSLIRYKDKPKPGALYFGPYTSADSARKTFELLGKLFPLRQCSDQELRRRTRPCILYDMKRCVAPCVKKCTKEEYEGYVERTIKFLKGQDKEILKELHEEMHQAAELLEFEKAGALLKTIKQIEGTIEGQKVDKPLGLDIDAISLFRQGDQAMLTLLTFQGGRLVASRNFSFENIIEEDAELIEAFICQHYEKQTEFPHEILLPILPEDALALEDVISQVFSHSKRLVKVIAPQKGEKRALLEMAQTNAEAAFKKEKDVQEIKGKILLEMQQKFRLSKYPHHIECFDNSNISGSSGVSSLVAFVEGNRDSSKYRKYKIRTVSGIDDYAALREVLQRRYRRGKEEGILPDLVVIDGGKGHLNSAIKVLEDLDLGSLDIIGVAKEKGRHDKGMTEEQVFLKNVKDPIILKKNSPILFLLQQIRDEAHRFAIAYHRKLRSKKNFRSAIDNIPGIGIIKRTLLIKHFGSVKKLAEASEANLKEVKGISKANIQAIQEYFREKK